MSNEEMHKENIRGVKRYPKEGGMLMGWNEAPSHSSCLPINQDKPETQVGNAATRADEESLNYTQWTGCAQLDRIKHKGKKILELQTVLFSSNYLHVWIVTYSIPISRSDIMDSSPV